MWPGLSSFSSGYLHPVEYRASDPSGRYEGSTRITLEMSSVKKGSGS